MLKNKIIISAFTAILLFALVFALLFFRIEEATAPFYITISSGEKTEKIKCFKNEEDEFFVFLPSYANLSDASIKLNTESDVYLDGKKINTGLECSSFDFNTPYALSFSKYGKKREYALTFLRSANIPTAYIDTASGNMDFIHAKKGNEESGEIRILLSDGTVDYTGDLSEINGRGNTNWSDFEKKSYSLQLKNASDLLDMGDAVNWILVSNAADPSNIRNKLAFDLAKEVGLPYSPDSRWVDLYLNGEYRGLYLLCERNEINQNRINISQNESFVTSIEPQERLESQNLPYIKTKSDLTLRIHHPKNITDSSKNSLLNLWQSVDNAIFSKDGIDSASNKKLFDIIDLNSWAKKFAFEEVCGNLDGYLASQYFFIDGADKDSKIYAGPIWDFDKSLGNDNDEYWSIANPKTLVLTRNQNNSFIATHLYNNDSFKLEVTRLFKNDIAPKVETFVGSKIDDYRNYISAAADLNLIRWGSEINSIDFITEISQVKSYLNEHTDFLYDIWVNDSKYYQVSFTNLKNDYFISVAAGEQLTEAVKIKSIEGREFIGLYYSDTDEPFDITKPITEDTKIYAKWRDNAQNKINDVIKLIPVMLIAIIFIALLIIEIKRIKRNG